MVMNPILEEVRRIKDELAREASHDIHRLCDNTRKWAAEHPHSGPVIHNAEELRQFLAHAERNQMESPNLVLKDEPPRPET
jgi:hypothetical protein